MDLNTVENWLAGSYKNQEKLVSTSFFGSPKTD
jgi:hypothetical protein